MTTSAARKPLPNPVRVLLLVMFSGALLLGTAGTLDWWNAWVFLAVNTLTVIAVTECILRKSPELEKERATARSRAKGWDKVIVPLLAAVFPILTQVLAGLDRRYGWTHGLGRVESLLALPLVVACNALVFYAMKSNPFFSSHVRIQSDRGHHVISEGPYAWVRHPAYLGIAVNSLAMAFLLGSLVALIPGIANALLTVLRTLLEDRTLQAELPGYEEYARRVRDRLFPWLY